MIFCFNKYSRIQINILSLIICSLFFIIIIFVSKFISFKLNQNSNLEELISESFQENNSNFTQNPLVENQDKIKYEWSLEIPSIDLYAEISEGTDSITLNKYIGHFEESKKESGNVCLAAHNRGYDVNYFAGLKEVEIGDEVIYFVNENEYKYIIDEIIVIYETDWTVIENTEEDRITLITCIENRDKYRLCVRGIREE